MKMRTGRIAGGTALADGISLINGLTVHDARFGKMCKHTPTFAVFNRDRKSVAICTVIGHFRCAIVRGIHDRSRWDAEIDPVVSRKSQRSIQIGILAEALCDEWFAWK